VSNKDASHLLEDRLMPKVVKPLDVIYLNKQVNNLGWHYYVP
jgi:hypothetical protein